MRAGSLLTIVIILVECLSSLGFSITQAFQTGVLVVEDFEEGLGASWSADAEKFHISKDYAKSGEHALMVTHDSAGNDTAVFRFGPLESCVIEFWLYILDTGRSIANWDSIGFSWKPLSDPPSYGPAFIRLLRDGSVIQVVTSPPPPPEVDIAPQVNDTNDERVVDGRRNWVSWNLSQKFPVGRWFDVSMVIHANRHIEFSIDGEYAGTVPADDDGEPIKGIALGGGLSQESMGYIVYVDDIEISYLQVSPLVSDIPDQNIESGETFDSIALDEYVSDPDNVDDEIVWSYSGNKELIVDISEDRIVTVTVPNPDWTGIETITFTATDPDGSSSSDSATFTIQKVWLIEGSFVSYISLCELGESMPSPRIQQGFVPEASFVIPVGTKLLWCSNPDEELDDPLAVMVRIQNATDTPRILLLPISSNVIIHGYGPAFALHFPVGTFMWLQGEGNVKIERIASKGVVEFLYVVPRFSGEVTVQFGDIGFFSMNFADTISPIITSDPSASNVAATSAVITWTTDETSSSVVEYGTKPEYGLTAEGIDNVTEHSVLLEHLSPNTIYYYRVGSTDANDNTTWSEQKTFGTQSEAIKRILGISSQEAEPGTQIAAQISITDTTGIASRDIIIKYDADVLTIGEAQATDLLSGMLLIVNKDILGEIRLSMAGAEGLPPGSGTLVEIGLMVNADAQTGTETMLEFGDTKIYDGSSSVIPINLKNGIVKIVGIKGDVNNDGKVLSNDATLALRIAVQLMVPTDYQVWAADMNEDGAVRANDATLILRTAAGLAAPGMVPWGQGNREMERIAPYQITVAFSEAHGIAGERIAVPIKVDDIEILASGDICIAYNSTVLRAVDVLSDSGVLLASNTSKPGILCISFAGANGLSDQTIAEIQFDVLADTSSMLKFEKLELYGIDTFPVSTIGVNSKFTPWAMVPKHNVLLQNFPNPFNPETWIPYQLADDSDVVITIYSATGESIRNIDLGYKEISAYVTRDKAAYWDGKNDVGEHVASGVYFYTIQAGGYTATRKMTLAK